MDSKDNNGTPIGTLEGGGQFAAQIGSNRNGLGALIAAEAVRERALKEVSVRQENLTFDVHGLVVDGQRIELDQKGRNRLFDKLRAPVWYWKKHGARFQAAALNEHLALGHFGHSPKLILRDGQFHTITRGDLIDLRTTEVLNALAESLGKEGESLLVSRIGRTDERFEVELVSESKAIAVRRGDIVRGGLSLGHSQYGNEATVIFGFNLRLVCTNGMILRECASRDGIGRTRKLPVEHPNGRAIQINQIRQLSLQHWNTIHPQLEALRATCERRANVEELLNNWLLRARMSRQEMMPRLLTAWREEGAESTHYGAVNALTRVATHDPDLSARQRRVLSALGGLLAFSQVHLCPRCYSLLSTLRGGADNEATDARERDDSAGEGSRDEQEVVAA